MQQKYKEKLKILGECIKNNWMMEMLLAVGCISVVAMLILTCWSHFDNLCDILKVSITAMVTLIGFSVTSYIFLNNTLQTRKNENEVEKEIIDLFQREKLKNLCEYLIYAVACIVVEIILLEIEISSVKGLARFAHKALFFGCFVACIFFTVLKVIQIGRFIYEIINYDEGLKKFAGQKLREEEEKEKANNSQNKKTKGEFLGLVNNLEIIAGRIIQNHVNAKGSSLKESSLQRALCDGKDSSDLNIREEVAKKYIDVINYRNLLLQFNDRRDSDNVEFYEKAQAVKTSFFEDYMHGEILTKIDLQNLTIENANLDHTSFASSSFHNVRFTGDKTTMIAVDFRESVLNDVIFENANCQNINFSHAKLVNSKSKMSRNAQEKKKGGESHQEVNTDTFGQQSDFSNAIFENADLTNVRFIRGNDSNHLLKMVQMSCDGVIMSNLTIENVDFRYSSFCKSQLVGTNIGINESGNINVKFDFANMEKANFLKSKIVNTSFKNAVLRESSFISVDKLQNCDFKGSNLERARFQKAVIEKCNFEMVYAVYVAMQNSIINDTSFCFATLNFADFTGAKIINANFTNATCRESLFIGMQEVSNSQFDGAMFCNCRISGRNDNQKVRFHKCTFTDAVFSRAMISYVIFEECDFQNVDFEHAKLTHVKFSECKNLKEKFENSPTVETIPPQKKRQRGLLGSS